MPSLFREKIKGVQYITEAKFTPKHFQNLHRLRNY